jgi:hypothetical protein
MVSRIAPDRYAYTGFAVEDTPPKMNQRLFAAMMRKTPAERLLMSLDMMATARELVVSGIQRKSGTESVVEAKRLAFQRLHGQPCSW